MFYRLKRPNDGEVDPMAFKQDEVYRCPDEACGCEVTVTKAAPADCPGMSNPTCCCDKTMEKVFG